MITNFVFFGKKYRLSSQCVLLHDLWVLKFNCSVADANLHRVSPSLKNWNCLHTPCDIFFMEHNGLRVSVNLHFLDATLCPLPLQSGTTHNVLSNHNNNQTFCTLLVDFESILGPFWVHLGFNMSSFWVNLGSILSPYWVILGPVC